MTFGDALTGASSKGTALLAFLRESAATRRKRAARYSEQDKILWLSEIPSAEPACRSPFFSDKPDDFGALWLQVRKEEMPTRPPVPDILAPWVRDIDLDNPHCEPELLSEIYALAAGQAQDTREPQVTSSTAINEERDLCRLEDNPEVEEAWVDYLTDQWWPWAQEMRRWRLVQGIYDSLDFMRRRLEEGQERYELILAIGFLEWKDSTGTDVARHVLTAPAELTFEASRGVITVEPAASFERFVVELDMLELQDRPPLDESKLDELLEALDIHAWDTTLVTPVLREIANRLRSHAQVEEAPKPSHSYDEHPRLRFAPALVLRERRPTAYEELVRKFHKYASHDELESTYPWLRLLSEGDHPAAQPHRTFTASEPTKPGSASIDRLLFPLPTNEEQRQIVNRLQADPCVLVKGPPGTGKSHTIANLICHLLASGNKVLVTAHSPKALTVLRGLLPSDIRDLCLTAVGSSMEDKRLLEESVRGILRRWDTRRPPEEEQQAIERAERELRELEDELATIERDLQAFREAETYSHELPGGYSGTAAQIARALAEQEQEFSWFPELPSDIEFPLDPAQSNFFTQAHARFTAEIRAELENDVGAADLASPEQFSELVTRLTAAEQAMQQASRDVDEAAIQLLGESSTITLDRLRGAVRELADLALRASRTLGPVHADVLQDVLAAADNRWSRLASASDAILKEATRLLHAVGALRFTLPGQIADTQLRRDVARRLAHFEAGGRKGFGPFAPKVVRETRYIEEDCRVDGEKASGTRELRCLRDYLDLVSKIRELHELWGGHLAVAPTPREAVFRASELTAELKALLAFRQSDSWNVLATSLGSRRLDLASPEARDYCLRTIEAVLSSQEVRRAQQELDSILQAVRGLRCNSPVHPCIRDLENSALTRNVVAYRAAWEERERVRRDQRLLDHYKSLLGKLSALCPELGERIRGTEGDPLWLGRVRKLRQAWSWAAARAWLRRISKVEAYEARVQDYQRVKQRIETATSTLAANLAWKAFLDRLNDRSIQHLKAWQKAVNRIGKGTGQHSYKHRRTARRYLMECVPIIPAWVMPLHKLWESIEAKPGLFDTVIVDEASQAGTDALILLLLAKRIVVVGDDKQNSPEPVGILEDDIGRLIREHLRAFRFRDEFRPDTSLFDHAERAFATQISLREHFRCVPEIIRFSNELCYREAPLIPLRQPPPERLPPLCLRFVSGGHCEGDGPRILNRAEAEAIVDTIVQLVNDAAYEGRTMGVIALQGHAQSQFIGDLLAKRLNPRIIEERRLRCGEPASFQGDERDVIFLSMVVAPNVRYRTLTGLADQRRFNVAMSRARDQVWLFHSVKPHDLSSSDLRYQLLQFFEAPPEREGRFEELDRLEREARTPRRPGNQPDPYESWFEVDVALGLLRRGFKVRPQVDVAGYRIDLVVEGADARLAVECDGDAWHGPEQYERDMARQRQLERAGWVFDRVRESDFYADRERSLDAVARTCEQLAILPVGLSTSTPSATLKPNSLAGVGGPTELRDQALGVSEDEREATDDSEVFGALDGPFTGYSEASEFPDPRYASQANIRQALRSIIQQDGPLLRSSVYRLYVEGCPEVERVGRTVRQVLNRALGTMLRAGEIVEEDELGHGSPEGQVLRVAGTPPVRVRPAGRRDLLEIPPSELRTVARDLARTTGPHNEEALFRAILDHYGFRRLTKSRREYLSRVVRSISSSPAMPPK
jgi:very-short-patch-repair endonuclease